MSLSGGLQGRAVLFAGIAAAFVALTLSSAPSEPPSAPAIAEARAAYGKLPLSFIPNRGQTDERVRYYAQAPGLGFFLTDDKAVLSLSKGKRGTALEMRFVGANPDARLEPGRRGEGKVNYLTGSEHQTGLPTYGEVTYRDLWHGIDMVFRGQGGKLKYEFHVAPGADPSKIRLAYAGAGGLAVGATGDLLVATPLGKLRDASPVSYQRIGGKRVPVKSRYAVAGTSAYGFALGAHDPRRALVIDPALEYSTYLGGGDTDSARDIAVDTQGNAYVVGNTRSRDFPTTPGSIPITQTGGYDVFVTKLNPAGSGLVYSTLLGGTGVDYSGAIAIDDSGSAYVTGSTQDAPIDFPTTPGALQTTNRGGFYDAFVSKLTPEGSALAYSTFLGGRDEDRAFGIAIADDGDAYVTGWAAGGFPTTPGAHDTSYDGLPVCSGDEDFSPLNGFVSRLNATGSALVFSTYLGGRHTTASSPTLDDSGDNVYIVGYTDGDDFPTTFGAFDRQNTGYTTCGGSSAEEGFVTKLDTGGTALVYSTLIGGARRDSVAAIALDSTGNAYVAGGTNSSDFPTTTGAFDTTANGANDAFVAKLNPSGSGLQYSTLIGGTANDGSSSIAIDAGGSAYVTGGTGSSDFPTTPGALDTSVNSSPGSDAFVTKITPSGSAFAYSTFLGGGDYDYSFGVGIDASGSAFVTGETFSANFPTTAGAFRRTPYANVTSRGDAFVTKLSTKPDGYPRPKSASPLEMTLVPANAPCTSPNRIHGPPLAFDSCNPPAQASDELTLGTPDANAKPVRGEGMVQYAALAGDPTTTVDEADVWITVAVHDVYDQQTLIDYTGEVRAQVGLRITDKLNNPGDNATVSDTTLGAIVPCAENADPNQGADCSVVTSADALAPGTVIERKRAVWELGQVRVDDGGADGDADTAGDNTLFMVQGVFVP